MDSPHDVESLLVHDRFVRGLARGLVRDHAAAEDLAQEAWLAALKSGERLASFPRWAGAALRNLARNAHRADARRGAREAAAARTEGVPSADEVLAREALRSELVAAVLALDEPLRAALLLRFFDGLGTREIAHRRGLPVETVRTHLKRGLAQLRARLERERGGAWAALVAPLARAPRPQWLERASEAVPSTLSTIAVMSTQAKLALAVVGVVSIAVLALQLRREGELELVTPPEVSAVVLQDPGQVEDEELAVTSAPEPTERVEVAAEPPATEPLTAEEHGSALVRVKWHDGTPAEGVGVVVQERWTSGSPAVRNRWGWTDALGELRVDALATGEAFVETDRGGHEVSDVIEIAAGTESELELVLARGFEVEGIVRDPLGAPVAGAEIVYASFTLDDSCVVARTDRAGAFHVRALGDSGAHVWARARGFAPSLCRQVVAGDGVTLEIELVLLGPGGALAGTVVDTAGAPVADAWVLAGLDHPLGVVERVPVGGARVVRGVLAGPSIARTDAEGRYVVEGLAPGRRQIAVRAVGFGAQRAEVEIVADVMQLHDVRLAPGVTVVGRITQADGTPATRASVEVGSYDVLRSEAHVDREGRYRLEGLEPGAIELVVTSVYQGDTRVTVHGAPGETVTRDIALVPGGSIRGRVLDERGAPLAGWQVYTQDEPSVAEDHDSAGAETDAEGRFELRDLHDRTHRVFVRHPEHLRFPALEVSGVRPGDDELVLTVADDQWPTVFVEGRVVDALGAPLPTARIAIGRELTGRMHGIAVDPQGEFHIGPMPSGTWCLRVHSGGLGPAQVVLGPRALAPDETWDCGDVVVPSDQE